METQKKLETPFSANIVNLAAGLLIAVIVVLVLRDLSSLLQPLFVAIFFFYIGEPIFQTLRRKRVPGWLARTFLFALVSVILFLIGWMIQASLQAFVEHSPSYRTAFQGVRDKTVAFLSNRFPRLAEDLRGFLSGETLSFAPIEKTARAMVGNVIGFLSAGLLVIFYMIFITQEAITLPKRLTLAYGRVQVEHLLEIGRRINHGIIRYVYVKSWVSLLIAVLSTVALLLFRIDLALVWGALIFFANFIPYVGSAAAVVFPIAISFLQYGRFSLTLVVGFVLVALQVFVGNYVEPKYSGRQLNLSPLVVMLSLAFWGWLWGMVGLVLSIPIMVSIKLVLENIPATRHWAVLLSDIPRMP